MLTYICHMETIEKIRSLLVLDTTKNPTGKKFQNRLIQQFEQLKKLLDELEKEISVYSEKTTKK